MIYEKANAWLCVDLNDFSVDVYRIGSGNSGEYGIRTAYCRKYRMESGHARERKRYADDPKQDNR
jgi:hypothetical protein